MGDPFLYRIASQRLMKRYLSLAIVCVAGSGAVAETAEYQVRRLIYLESSCGVESLSRLDASPGHERFKAVCRNISAYPDGLEVACSDPSDDRSCKVLTPAVMFDQLELLQPKSSRLP